ncbi:bifunctional UDP-N-acetylglucosamine diphosphorylase/glucosamine-1-phosphate N-acetyltransferase GlmU [Pseudactinotalea sp. Z1739]|uniref:bifunctional UDP-N-acetylglucosamine diphosphorylase/glucosamine-1-phosphate N-acetyltransferase GlmU n=1 Tax=Pseudactinotalea sp. Z1739 TaxID=3413028 RepID=UPI003C7E3DF9
MSRPAPAAVVILAAGQGTRMRSARAKVLHPIGGVSLLGHVLATARAVEPEHLVTVVRHQRDQVAEHIEALDPDVLITDQDEIPGTGRAVQCGLDALDLAAQGRAMATSDQREKLPRADEIAIDGTVVVLLGDVPLLQPQTVQEVLDTHHEQDNAVTVLTTHLPDASGYGRIVRDQDGAVTGIVEHGDATPEQRAITEINSGVFAFDAAVLRDGLGQVDAGNNQGEVYLTDVLAHAHRAGNRVGAVVVADSLQVEGVNDRVQLATLGAELNARTLRHWMRAGVSIVDPTSTWVDVGVELEPDVTLLPGTQLHGQTHVLTGATIGPDTTLTDVQVGPGATVIRSHGEQAQIDAGATVGPFAYLRPGTVLGERGKIGTFVETKNAQIGAGSKVPHLSYIGDATIGRETNIGAASVTVNYDGVTKRRTTIGDHARTGADNMFVAPVTVGDGAYTGAGTVLRRDVPPGALGISGGQQRNIENWVLSRRAGTPAAQAAQAALEADEGDGASAELSPQAQAERSRAGTTNNAADQDTAANRHGSAHLDEER